VFGDLPKLRGVPRRLVRGGNSLPEGGSKDLLETTNATRAGLRQMGRSVKWAIGVTAVRERVANLLPLTLRSLEAAGFASPRVFLDGFGGYLCEDPWGGGLTGRVPAVGAFGNWILAAWELWIREPAADRYAIFQDDVLVVRGLREYLEARKPEGKWYLNLYTTRENGALAGGKRGWFLSNQLGKGALGLVFERDGLGALLGSAGIVAKPHAVRLPKKNIDGAVVNAMKRAKYREWCHYPSLAEHIGEESVLRNAGRRYAPSFPGEKFDARGLLK